MPERISVTVQYRKGVWLESLTRSNQEMDGAHGQYGRARSGPRAGEPQVDSRYVHKVFAALIAILLVLTAGSTSSPAQSSTECIEQLAPSTPVSALHTQPGAGAAPIMDEIIHSRCSIDISMYLFTSDEIVQGLQSAEQRGVRVRVLLEAEPFGTLGNQQEIFDELIAIGAEVQWSPPQFTFLHAKYMIVDGSSLVVTNQNFTGSGFESNREFGVVTTEPGPVGEAIQIFESDWSGTQPPSSFQHLIVSPVNSREMIVNLINGSQDSLWMYAEVLRDEDVTLALDNAVDRGVDVRLLVNASASEDDAPYFLDALDHGVQVRTLEDPYVHSKAMIVDNTYTLIGSQNYSYTSLDLNREVGIILSDDQSLHIVSSTFENDWSRAVPVETISIVEGVSPNRLTQPAWIGKLTCGRWGVV